MTVSNNQVANETTFNNAFGSKTANNTVTGVQDLNNSNPASGFRVTNLQRELNALGSAIGMAVGQVYNYTLTWASDIVGLANDTVKARVEALVAKFHGSTGHTHSGAAGDGPLIRSQGLRSYAGDAARNTAEGTPSQGAMYLNTLTGNPRVFDGTLWLDVGIRGDSIRSSGVAIANNQATPATITGATIDTTVYSAMLLFVSIKRETNTTKKRSTGFIMCQYVNGAWEDPAVQLWGAADIGLTFSMSGDILAYTSDNQSGTGYTGTIEFRGMTMI